MPLSVHYSLLYLYLFLTTLFCTSTYVFAVSGEEGNIDEAQELMARVEKLQGEKEEIVVSPQCVCVCVCCTDLPCCAFARRWLGLGLGLISLWFVWCAHADKK